MFTARSLACLAFAGATLLGSCRSLGPAPEQLRPLLQENETGALRHKGRVEIRSEWFGGEFTVLAIEQGGEQRRVRFQLIPDFGGKILDVVTDTQSVVALWPHDGKVEREREGLIGFLAISLVEQATPLTWERVLGGERTQSGYRVQLQPASNDLDLELHADLSPSGELLARHYKLGFVRWSEDFQPRHAIRADGFEWVFLEESSESIATPADALFRLKLPEDTAP